MAIESVPSAGPATRDNLSYGSAHVNAPILFGLLTPAGWDPSWIAFRCLTVFLWLNSIVYGRYNYITIDNYG